MGLPLSRMNLGMVGAPSSYTLDGPPERVNPLGFSALTRSSETWCGRSSEYTCSSRTRRVMSWLYWEPKWMTAMQSRLTDSRGEAGAGLDLDPDVPISR